MDKLEAAAEALKKLAAKFGPNVFEEAEVISVDETEYLANLKTDEGLELYECRLRALASGNHSVDMLPKVGSKVMICKLADDDYQVLACDEITSFRVVTGKTSLVLNGTGAVFNGGSLGGLVKVKELQAELNKTNAVVQDILQVLIGAPVPEPGNGSPSALQATLKTILAGKTVGNFSGIENEKVKQ